MKISDNYQAKVKLWASSPQVTVLPYVFRIPNFRSRKFSSYEEFNAWKRGVMLACAKRKCVDEPHP